MLLLLLDINQEMNLQKSETCQPCKELLPDVEELSKKYDVKVVGDAASPRRILDATAEAYRVINGL